LLFNIYEQTNLLNTENMDIFSNSTPRLRHTSGTVLSFC